LGVPVIEVGFPAISSQERETIRRIVELGLKASIQVIARALESDIELAISTGSDIIAIFIGTSEYHLLKKLRMTQLEVIKAVCRSISFAKRAGVQIAFAPEDATRTDLKFLHQVCKAAQDSGADVIGLPDTVGIMTPRTMGQLVASLSAELTIPIAVHCHNDFGLAVANSLAALEAGALGIQCSINGLGERAGNASLAEVACALSFLYNCDTGLDLTQLEGISSMVAAITKIRLPNACPIVGKNAFTHESGTHIAGILQDPITYEPFDPALIGRERNFVFGKHSGKSAIEFVLRRNNINASEEVCEKILEAVKHLGEMKGVLSEKEVIRLSTEYLRDEEHV
jgi:isopropylmalate/homocitrate/citramalate synthase